MEKLVFIDCNMLRLPEMTRLSFNSCWVDYAVSEIGLSK